MQLLPARQHVSYTVRLFHMTIYLIISWWVIFSQYIYHCRPVTCPFRVWTMYLISISFYVSSFREQFWSRLPVCLSMCSSCLQVINCFQCVACTFTTLWNFWKLFSSSGLPADSFLARRNSEVLAAFGMLTKKGWTTTLQSSQESCSSCRCWGTLVKFRN